MTTTLHPTRATKLENARRNARRLAHEVLNPDERMIWAGYCEGKVGQQSKAAAAGAATVLLSAFIFGVTMIGVGSALNEILGNSIGFVPGFLAGLLVLWKVAPYLEAGRDDKMYCRQQTVYALTNER